MSGQTLEELSVHFSNYHKTVLTCAIASESIYEKSPLDLTSEDDYNRFSNRIERIVISEMNPLDNQINQTKYMICERDELLIVVFRGTDNLDDWLNDITKSDNKLSNIPGDFHSLFLKRSEEIPIEFFVEKIVKESYKIVFTGHSYAGAIAGLVTIRILFNEQIFGNKVFLDKILCIGFGSPVFADDQFKKYVERYYKNNFHFYFNETDIIPNLSIYRHFGVFVYLKGDAKLKLYKEFYYPKSNIKLLKDHLMVNYRKNIVKILEKENIKVFKTHLFKVGEFKLLFIPIKQFQRKSGDELKRKIMKYSNNYSVKLIQDETNMDLKLCCKGLDYIIKTLFYIEYVGSLILKISILKTKEGKISFGSITKKESRNSVMIKYEIPNEFLRILKGFYFKNPIEKLKITKAEIELISPYERTKFDIEFSKEDKI
jgi:predicted lipase